MTCSKPQRPSMSRPPDPRPAPRWRPAARHAALARWVIALGGLALGGQAWAQSSCASDRTRPPSQVLERFIDADCAACWRDPGTPTAAADGISIDWVLPGPQGDEAALSAVARREGLDRPGAGAPRPRGQASALQDARLAPGARLRVAQGPAIGGYIGSGLRADLPGSIHAPLRAWLLLVERLPAGTEGSPVDRLLVRNAQVFDWPSRAPPALGRRIHVESRPLNVPEGARPERLRLLAWVEDTSGRVLARALTPCAATGL